MRKGGGKQKGASWEREVCRELSLWMSYGKQEDLYWRSAMSGGRSTVAARKGVRLAAQCGDISCIHPIGAPLTNKFLIENKFHADLNFLGLLTGKGKLMGFWQEVKVQAKAYGKNPLLIAKQNHVLPVVCMGFGGSEILGLNKRSLLIAPRSNLRIIPLHEFLKYATRPT